MTVQNRVATKLGVAAPSHHNHTMSRQDRQAKHNVAARGDEMTLQLRDNGARLEGFMGGTRREKIQDNTRMRAGSCVARWSLVVQFP